MGARRRTYDLADRAKLGGCIRAVRVKATMSQKQVADVIGQPQSYIARIESGERQLLALEFFQICKVLGVAPADVNGSFVDG